MKLAIMQPYFFPYIGYWQLINAVDKFIILDDVNYIKGGWINRNRILLNGKDHLFTLPLKDASPNRLIKEITLIEISKWKKKFLNTLNTEYKKAPFFTPSFNLIVDCLSYNNINLSSFIVNSIKRICAYLEIKTEIIETSSIYNDKQLKKEKRLISICHKESACEYINPEGGQSLYNKNSFAEERIKLNFIKSGEIKYPQFENDFVPFLSIIDVIMFNSKEKIKDILKNYILV